jgi:hypothetical protein
MGTDDYTEALLRIGEARQRSTTGYLTIARADIDTVLKGPPAPQYEEKDFSYFDGPVWSWFSLSYAAYAVMPRAVLCMMPLAWQKKFVDLMNELTETLTWNGTNDYTVQIRDDKGRFIEDPLANYKYLTKGLIKRKGIEND